MWFWIGLALVLLWGAWGYLRRRWWLSEIEKSMARNSAAHTGPLARYEAPHWIALPDRIVTATAGAAAIIGIFLMVGSRWGWFG